MNLEKRNKALWADNVRMRDMLRRIRRHVDAACTPGSASFEHWEYALRIVFDILYDCEQARKVLEEDVNS